MKRLFWPLFSRPALPPRLPPHCRIKSQRRINQCRLLPELSQGGVVDYGTIHTSELSDSAVNQLGRKPSISPSPATRQPKSPGTSSMTAWTAAPALPSTTDATGGSVSDASQTYGVGKAKDVAIGNYSLFVNVGSVVADTNKVDAIVMDGNNSVWTKSTDGLTAGLNSRDFTVATCRQRRAAGLYQRHLPAGHLAGDSGHQNPRHHRRYRPQRPADDQPALSVRLSGIYYVKE
jgi:hypothetical protein